MIESKRNGSKIDPKWLAIWMLSFTCLLLIFYTFLVVSDHNELVQKFDEVDSTHQYQLDSLVRVVTEHKPDRVFMDAYFILQQHERMREHQLRCLNMDLVWLQRITDELYSARYGVLPNHWSKNLDVDQYEEALRNPELLVNQMP